MTTHWVRVLVDQLATQAKVVEARTLCTRTSSKGSPGTNILTDCWVGPVTQLNCRFNQHSIMVMETVEAAERLEEPLAPLAQQSGQV